MCFPILLLNHLRTIRNWTLKKIFFLMAILLFRNFRDVLENS